MDWAVIGTVAEIIGSAGVIISLIYLGLQVRHANKQSELEAIRTIWSELSQVCDKWSESKETASIIVRGRSSLASLDEAERLIFEFSHIRLLNALESWYLQIIRTSKPGPFLDRNLENIADTVRGYLDFPGVREFWPRVRHEFSPIADLIDQNLTQDSI